MTIYGCKNRPQVTYKNGKVSILLEVDVEVGIVELQGQEVQNDAQREYLKRRLKEVLEQRTGEVFEKVQQSLGCDIYGYGNMIYRNDYDLWKKIGANWDRLFKEAKFEARAEVVITHAGLMSQ